MNITITAPPQGGVIAAIPSKSQAHRLLICAALADAPTDIACSVTSQDIEATADCLRALGAGVERTEKGYHVIPIDKACPNPVLRCRESGSTLRFLLPITAALGTGGVFLMEGRLPDRPQEELLQVLERHGCRCSRQGNRLSLSGRLKAGEIAVRGDVSSQYVSGLLFALPLMEDSGVIELTCGLQSRPYVDMTVAAMERFGITAYEQNGRFRTQGKYSSPRTAAVEGDWSNAAFWLCAGALCDKAFTCTGLEEASPQGDRAVMALLRQMGASVCIHSGEISVLRGELRGVEIDARDIPDLIPALSAVAATAQGETRIIGAERLRLKESDRLQAVARGLSALGADVEETDDGLHIQGKPKLAGGVMDACGDHRIAMMGAIAALGCTGPVTVLGAEAVEKSYPAFWEHYRRLGGVTEEH